MTKGSLDISYESENSSVKVEEILDYEKTQEIFSD